MVCNGEVKHVETHPIYVDERKLIIFITLKLFVSHFNRGLGGKISIHRKIAWVVDADEWRSRFKQRIHYQVHYQPHPSVDGALGTY